MEQKVIQIGNSTGVIIPKPLLDGVGLKPGSQVVIETDPEDGSLIIREKGKAKKKTTISPEFLDMLARVNKNYGPALKELAQK
ncbi:hypothetical protein A2631_03045 [Candidatus Daviesbacteria bacterium RIFCSPHIGHO2_01_FULL_44_29]|uniref:SpoVT-AbrB domain-containing protein n=1 Tax=Candidatus Daviesbacteria bacterium RIFCSPHIGHO2_02_FULL_43_12 TaxID=1797776 RepID=A0A1F5KKM0_9BACT|nr:MAG: hypothetical protein A2631_03045 [Candidatus Daviesbacteria bacterium RIFCSPHIGHO2_01_FULL_44_29]OGE40787.1 MAG: hypothetical protein A3E86_02300 [Candidatus Daviesbacteria bacterium RIFCSPHIGHO2_12_FULL_47_45]OGE41360.1 MAG: hypothetical protein A3D25_02440 [Candidatus Daviesbacteria bacterium RIFCSPHIGHO2_02_FULL_43_12]OGE69561.1 MAG: hypothetical protein A3B55_04185 [Candidatus Daviesbacteria bacterium RIFCSPLOWO2_01_FULL_43_15]